MKFPLPTPAAVAGMTALLGLIYCTARCLPEFDPASYTDHAIAIIVTMTGGGFAHHLGRRIEQPVPATPPQKETDHETH